eukprot:GHVS01017905.1.p1 GENE.GHVS01017905.1~~GHVS01017905.1.p1  ORF type:complete len:343 (+),score=55.41 GHVS01017905.1:731-1759(+)
MTQLLLYLHQFAFERRSFTRLNMFQVSEQQRSILEVSNISNSLGEIEDCEKFSSFLRYGFFDELDLTEDSLEQHPIVVACPPSSSHRHLRNLMQGIFEHFPVPSVALVDRPVLALRSCGLSTGTVLDIGHCVTNVSSVYEGYVLGNSTVAGQPLLNNSNGLPDGVSALAGQSVTEALSRMLLQSATLQSGERMVDNLSGVSQRLKEEMAVVRPKRGEQPTEQQQRRSCALSSGQTVSLEDASVLSQYTEILFSPSLAGAKDSESLPNLVRRSVHRCGEADLELRLSLREVGHGPDGFAVRSSADAVWEGGVRFAMESDLPKWSISRADYDEVGDNAAPHRRS